MTGAADVGAALLPPRQEIVDLFFLLYEHVDEHGSVQANPRATRQVPAKKKRPFEPMVPRQEVDNASSSASSIDVTDWTVPHPLIGRFFLDVIARTLIDV